MAHGWWLKGVQWHPLFGLGLVTWLWMKACGWCPYVLLGKPSLHASMENICPKVLFTMIWCMCDLCQKVFVGLWCYQHIIDKLSLWWKFPIAAVMMGWVSVCMFKAWNGCGWQKEKINNGYGLHLKFGIWNLLLQQIAGRFWIWECGLLEFEYGKKHGLCERLNIGIVALWH